MRFVFTMAVATFKGNPVQEVIGDYPASSLQEIYAHIQKGQRWFLVEQLYHRRGDRGETVWTSNGSRLLHARWIGMIKLFKESEADR